MSLDLTDAITLSQIEQVRRGIYSLHTGANLVASDICAFCSDAITQRIALETVTLAPGRWITREDQAAVASERSLRFLQTNLPWSVRYSQDFRSSPATHKDFAHALHHVSKAAGQLHALCDDMDHDRQVADDPTLRARHAKYVADLVICALRLANTCPGGVIDLQRAVEERIESKNGVTLAAGAAS